MPVGKVEVHAPRPSLTVYIAEYMNYLVTKISCGYNKLSKKQSQLVCTSIKTHGYFLSH